MDTNEKRTTLLCCCTNIFFFGPNLICLVAIGLRMFLGRLEVGRRRRGCPFPGAQPRTGPWRRRTGRSTPPSPPAGRAGSTGRKGSGPGSGTDAQRTELLQPLQTIISFTIPTTQCLFSESNYYNNYLNWTTKISIFIADLVKMWFASLLF